ncbi:hypothetical protein ACHAWF_018231 [Thalassiosira exigua]
MSLRAKRRRPVPSLAIIAVCAMRSSPYAGAWSIQKVIVEWVKTSPALAALHQEHVASDEVRHMMKSTPLVHAPDESKAAFARGPFGRAVADIMEAEQRLLGDWKVEKIVEAAGGGSEGFDEEVSHERLLEALDGAPVVLISFVDCPWCLLAKELLREEHSLVDGDGTLRVIELEELGREGKRLRASIALATGRTSMPACFVGGRSVGGYTDGFDSAVMTRGSPAAPASPERDLRMLGSPGLATLHESGELASLLRAAIN